MRSLDPKELKTAELHQYLLGIVAPRPIAFASTLDEEGRANLAPYSFFNCFSSNPPILVFSSNRRVANNTTKDTLHNVEVTGEVVINAVSYAIVRQMALASVEFPLNESEFEQTGLTPIPSEVVKPFRVKESPAQLECVVRQIIPLGDQGGAGHLIISEVVRVHVRENILDEKDRINPHKIDLMGRMGRAFYTRASGEAIHRIYQPVKPLPIGYAQLPESVRHSTVLTGNDLGRLAAILEAPTDPSLQKLRQENARVQEALAREKPLEALHQYAQIELAKDNAELAARIAWLGEALFGKDGR